MKPQEADAAVWVGGGGTEQFLSICPGGGDQERAQTQVSY